jgi:hypothetical protein
MKLRCWQAERLSRAIRPMLGYLYRLRLRVEQQLDAMQVVAINPAVNNPRNQGPELLTPVG